jgi:hypothetical protein
MKFLNYSVKILMKCMGMVILTHQELYDLYNHFGKLFFRINKNKREFMFKKFTNSLRSGKKKGIDVSSIPCLCW